MKKRKSLYLGAIMAIILFFGLFTLAESNAWARAGGGGSSGSRGSRSFSSPSTPAAPSPSRPFSSPGSMPGAAPQPSSGSFSRSPFLQGLAGGVAGGFLGNMLFGSSGVAAPMGGHGGGGMGFFDIVILGLLAYFGWKFYRRWRFQKEAASYYGDATSPHIEAPYARTEATPYYGGGSQESYAGTFNDLERGLEQLRRVDPAFDEDAFKELAQDMFFRIQAGWMNRGLEGIESLMTGEMAKFFRDSFEEMKQKGRINRLENIAVRKVEFSEAWQETGKDYITIFFTANLLDYTVDDRTGQVLEGDKLNPVKFQEFWTFTRDIGGSRWQLSAINQAEGPARPS